MSIVQLNKEYKLSLLDDLVPVSECPDECGGMRFSYNPTAECRGRMTCWYSDTITGQNLIKFAPQRFQYCKGCDVAMFKGTDKYCSTNCEETNIPEQKCQSCNNRSYQCRDVTVKESLRYDLDGGKFPYYTRSIVVCEVCIEAQVRNV